VVFHDVINVKHARKAAEQGVDGLIWFAPAPAGTPARCRRSRWCAR
jgi:nitronate monooxygenase